MKYTKFVYKKLFDFYRNQQGVYALLTAAISFVLLGIIALAVDGSGMLLDKARLSQGLEQGALALAAEANKPRISQGEDLSGNGYLTAQKVTQADKKDPKFAGFSTDNQIRGYKRDQELLKSYVQSYLPDAKLPRDFEYDCTEKSNPRRVVNCYAQGDIDRPSWLPLNNTSLTFQPEVKIASDRVYIGKNLDDVAPLDLMLVTDLTGSMALDENGKDTKNTGKQSKIAILREVVAAVGDELLDNNKQREDISPHNRIRFTSFAFGAAQPNDNKCYLPYNLSSQGIGGLFNQTIGWQYGQFSNRTRFDAWKWGVENYPYRDNTSDFVYGSFLMALEGGIDYPATVSDIASFNGSKRSYRLSFAKNSWCLGENRAVATTSNKWYVKGEAATLKSDLNRLEPSGATLSSSGVLIGANLLMDSNQDKAAQPATLRSNTQRILLVLSDGRDEIYGNNTSKVIIPDELFITKKLIDAGMCPAITNRLNSLQNSAYPKRNARIHFVAFGYTASGEQKDAWLRCVGANNYHEAKNKQQLLDTFRQITGLQEEVGHITPNRDSNF